MKRTVCLTLLLVFAITARAQEAPRPLTISDYFSLKSIGDPQISPDAKWIAYTVSTMDLEKDKSETRIWMVPAAGGEAIPMTAKGYSASSPRWSPDGKYLSFLAKRSESGDDKTDSEDKTQVWSLNRLGGEAQQVTAVVQGVSGFEWAPNSERLLLLIRDPKPHELTEDKKDDKKAKPYVVDRLQFKRDYSGYLDRFRTHLYVLTPNADSSEPKQPVQITSGDFDDGQPAWSPDGRYIAFVSNRTDEPDANPNSDIWIVAADNGDKGATLVQLTNSPREDIEPTWSPDGKIIAYTTISAPLEVLWYATNNLAVIPATGGTSKTLTSGLDRNVDDPNFSADGKTIYFQIEDSGEQQLASIPSAGGKITRLVTGESIVRDIRVEGSFIALRISTPENPGDVFSFSDGDLKQITHTNKTLLDQIVLPKPVNIHYQSADGTEIEAFLYKPIDASKPGGNAALKYPLILNPHGGPVSQYNWGFNFQAQLWAAHGYLVLHPNPRGSSGYGQAFSYALDADWGNLDYQDVIAGVDHAIAEHSADPTRLGVGGWSYGGILTNYVITQTDRFKGAVSGASEALYRSNYGHDHYQMWWEVELGLPWENAAAWERISPFNKVGKITTPTLWIGGALDWNVPILNSEQMYQAMKRLGQETQLVVYPGEHHGIRRPTFQQDRFERFLGWFDKYVKGEAE